MKISVIVPTYKPQAYLWECLGSIYNQTFPKKDFELILVLNGCNEPYNTQIKEWLSVHSDLQVQYFQVDKGGVSNARNMALEKIHGKYIAFIDDDDFISPLYLEELYDKSSSKAISLCYPYAFNDEMPYKQLKYTITDAYEYCVKNQCNTIASKARKFFSGPCMKLIPISIIQKRRFDVRFNNGEDSLFMFLISDRIKEVTFTSKKAVYYRRFREDSATTRKRGKMEVICNQLKMLREYSWLYFNHMKHYNLIFYFTRILGAIKSMW